MKLNKVLCLFLMLAAVFSLASCSLIDKTPLGDLIEKLPFVDAKYDVEFDSNGGSEVESQVVVEGETATAPEEPTKEGYTFVGWFFGDTEWNFDNPVTEDMVLVAKWEKTSEGSCEHADENNDGKCDKCNEIIGDASYTITYMDGSAKLDLSPSSYTSESTGLKLPTAPAKAHYEFIGWFSDSALKNKVDSIEVGSGRNLVFYAGYSPVSYRIDYQLDGGVGAEDNLTSYTVLDLPLTLADPAKEGYEFKGWYTDANYTNAISSITAGNIGNLTVYAKWEKARPSHTITYLDHEGTLIATETFYESDNDQPVREAYELEGYTFLGWVDAADSSIVYDCIPAGTATDLTVKANMKLNAVTHNVVYHINGEVYYTGIFEEEIGLAEILPANKAGYEFDGWYATPECDGEKVTSIPAGTTADVVLYGTHTAITYTVKYYDGDIELPFEPTTYQVSDTDIALPEIPAKDGLKVIGWHDAEGNKYSSISAGTYGDLVLYAKYESATFYITYHLNGGENSEDNVTEYNYDEIPTLYTPVNREGYLFEGWYTDATFSGKAVNDLTDYANRDITLYAKWTPANNESDNTTPEVPF